MALKMAQFRTKLSPPLFLAKWRRCFRLPAWALKFGAPWGQVSLETPRMVVLQNTKSTCSILMYTYNHTLFVLYLIHRRHYHLNLNFQGRFFVLASIFCVFCGPS